MEFISTDLETAPTRILFVDDEEAICRAISRHFSRLGYDVSTANTADQALAKIAAHGMHIVVADMRMPGADGVSLLKSIRTAHSNVRVIMLTGHATRDNMLECQEWGAEICLFKPLDDYGELEEAVSRAEQRAGQWAKVFDRVSG